MILTRKSRLSRLLTTSASLITLLITSACVVGPKFKKPAAPDVTGYTPAPITNTNLHA